MNSIWKSKIRMKILLGEKQYHFFDDLHKAVKKFPDLSSDALSIGQLKSKQWLVEILENIYKKYSINLGTIYVLCGWYGILPAMLFMKFDMDKIRSFDIDKKCEKIADQVNKTHSNGWKFKAITEDIFKINFKMHSWQCWSNKNKRMSRSITDIPNTIINTSCEHTNPEWFDSVPKGKFIILQSNDFFTERGHVNAVTDLDEFIDMFPLSITYYKGKMNLQKYTRYMLMGIK